jgi:hypothetical protein
MIGTTPRQVSTAVWMMPGYSSPVSEKNSPVPPAANLGAQLGEAGADVGHADHLDERGRQRVDRGLGHGRRGHHALVSAGLEVGDALLGQRGHVADDGHAGALGHADHLQLARLHQRVGGHHAVEHHLRGAGHGVVDGRRAAAVGHVLPLHAGGQGDVDQAQVVGRAAAGRGAVQLVGLRPGRQFLHRGGRHRRVHHQQVRRVGQHGHALQLLGLERQVLGDEGADGQRTQVGQQHGVRVGGVGHHAGAQVAEAPVRFSMTTACPSASDSGWLMERAMMSDDPPGGYGTMILIGLDGQFPPPLCANARTGKLAANVVARAAPSAPRRLMVMLCLQLFDVPHGFARMPERVISHRTTRKTTCRGLSAKKSARGGVV